ARTVSAGIYDFETGGPSHQSFREFASHDASRHDHIGEQEINWAARVFPYFKSVFAGTGFEHRIALKLEDLHDHLAKDIFVLRDQDSFPAVRKNGIRLRGCFFRAIRRSREIDAECRTFVWFAFHFEPSMVLADNSEDGGQTKSGAFSNGFG